MSCELLADVSDVVDPSIYTNYGFAGVILFILVVVLVSVGGYIWFLMRTFLTTISNKDGHIDKITNAYIDYMQRQNTQALDLQNKRLIQDQQMATALNTLTKELETWREAYHTQSVSPKELVENVVKEIKKHTIDTTSREELDG